ncbi:MAG: DUF805 domain-containing protein [Clostridia bacterium]|nr:DUF805 domain-containing protein [Clostridia bacterium]
MVNEMINGFVEFFTRYVDFTGTTDRKKFWLTALAMLIVEVVLGVLVKIPLLGIIFGIVSAVYGLATLIPGIAICVRRLRDAGFHWAWMFILLTGIGSIVILIFCCMPKKA